VEDDTIHLNERRTESSRTQDPHCQSSSDLTRHTTKDGDGDEGGGRSDDRDRDCDRDISTHRPPLKLNQVSV
jgi:hypothetical protein